MYLGGIMKKFINKILFIINMLILSTPMMVLADSGLESKYESSSSIAGSIISTFIQCFSFFAEMLTKTPSDKDFILYRNIVVITCLIILYIVVAVNLFKFDHKKEKKTLIKLTTSLFIH